MNSKFLFLYIVIFAIPLFGQNDIQVITSNRNTLIIAYTPSYSDTSIIKIDNGSYIKIRLRYGIISHPEDWGMPSVPERIITVGVPSETGNTIQIISSEYKTINGMIAPKPEMVRDKKNMNSFVYKVKSGYNNYKQNTELASFGDYGMLRSIPVQGIEIFPVEYNAQQNIIKLYTKIIIQINFATNQAITSKPASDFLSGAVLNFGVAKYWAKNTRRLKKTLVNSVLSSGTWVRFETKQEGIYKITKTMLASYGIDPSTVDPRTIKIYNNGGKVLPEDVNAPRPSDLVENAIMVVGQDDGKFDDGDYILFYGRGNDFWDFDSTSDTIKRYFHPYSKVNYYWITSGGSPGKRIEGESSINSSTYYTQTSTKSFAQLDQDKINIGKTGREYYGDNFSTTTTSRTYLTDLNNRLDNYPITYNIRFINASGETVGLNVDENSTQILNVNMPGWNSYTYPSYHNGEAYYYTTTYNGILPNNRSLLKFNFVPTTTSSLGYIDYFEILYQSQLKAVNDTLLFFSKDTTSAIQYNLSGFSSSNIQVFNVSDYSNVKIITNAQISGGNCTFQENETSGHVSKYFAVGSGNYLTPSNPVTMQNSNLHGIQTGAQYVIITNKIFDDAANKLSAYKENQAPEKYSTIVVNIDQIYNEFSCGMTDPTAMRDFLKYAYDNWQIRPKYVLFFGKGTYDAKDVEGYNEDFVPAYETQESLYQIYSYTTDDYFVRVDGNDPYIDIAYGRIPVITDAEANTAVDKIIQYETTQDKGLWRNLITLVADDDYTSEGYEGDYHTEYSETLSNNYIPTSFDQHKIYLGMYPVVITGEGRRYPQVNKDIVSALNNGTLIINYFGHGSPSLWAHEQVFVQSTTIPQLDNSRYFFLVAGTCDFGYWDDPSSQSSAEELLLLPHAGAIATFTSARVAIAQDNESLVDELFQQLLFSPRDSAGYPITLGQAVLYTKQILYDTNSQKYEILGDPTISLLIPKYTASIDSIDGINPVDTAVQIKALSNVRVSGEIKKPDNTVWQDFNGTGILTVYDSQREIIVPAISNSLQISQQGGLLFRGNISVTNGRFKSDFTVPKDISYENKNGKAIIYFYNNTNNNADGLGYTTNVIVGGTDSSRVNNKIGPDISIYIDDTTSKVISLANPNSTLIVKLSDDNGLNTTGTGIGHKMEGILNNDINNPIDFTDDFVGNMNAGGKSGEIRYQFNNLDPGNYTLKVTAWDVFNNSSSKTVSFTVVSGNGLVIKDVYNYPDPFEYNTTFTFQQNLAAPINVKIKVYTIAGRLIREIEKEGIQEKFVKVNWDGRDQDGSIIANGTYLYKIIVNSSDGKYSKSVLGKMAVIR